MKKTIAVLIVVSLSSFIACELNGESETYAVTYDGNGNTSGTPPVDSTDYSEDDIVTVAGVGTLVKTGYFLSTWNMKADGSGAALTPQLTFSMPSEDMTLYAQWTAGGKLTVTIANATTFTGHSIYYSIYDSNASGPTGGPTGNILGQAKLDIVNNTGSVVTATSTTDPSEKLFPNGTYYLGGMVDMNDNAASMGYAIDSGDRYGPLVTVVVTGDTSFALAESAFSMTY